MQKPRNTYSHFSIRSIVILILLLCANTSKVSAQAMQWSNPSKLKGAAIFTKVIGENEHGVYMLRYRNKFFSKNVIIDKYHHHLDLDQSKAIDLKRSRLIKIKMMDQGIMVVKSNFDRSEQSNVLYGQYYSYDLKLLDKPVRLMSSAIQDFGDRGNFRVRVSDDQTKIAILHTSKSNEDKVTIHWDVFDPEWNKVSSKEVIIPSLYKDFYFTEFMVTNEGTVISLAREFIEIDKREKKSIERLFITEQDSLFDFQLADSLEYHDMEMSFDRSNKVVVITAFFGKTQLYGSKGLLTFKYDVESKKTTQYTTRFTEKMVKELKLGSPATDVIPEGFEFLQIIPRSDGGLLCVAEQKEVSTESDIVMVNGIPTSTSKNIYNYNDILVINLDSAGKVEWSHVIHKNQTTVNDGGYFSSAVVFVDQNFIQLIYNDQLRSTGDVMQYTLYSNGKMMSKKLLKSELDYVVVIPVESSQVASNKVIIPTSKNRRFALLKLVYD